ncbi:MAG: ATP-dependent helicase [Calditrichaeota bacterium]|nr:MAG: ATP-dependent helicase [Calditrichota bacterium]
MDKGNNILTGIRDNHNRGKVGDFLNEKIKSGSKLSVVSAFFTIYAYAHLKEKLDEIDSMDFLFGEPKFVSAIDPEKTDSKSFHINNEEINLSKKLEQKRIARECANWIAKKVNIRSIKKSNLLHGKLYHINNDGIEEAILGSSNFTVRGLGFGELSNIELNLEVDSRRDRSDLFTWFQEIWNDAELVEDVKAKVLDYLKLLYRENEPEFVYYKTLFHIFEKFLGEQADTGLLYQKTVLVETEVWKKLFEFQKDGVRAAINKILKHNGCIIADSVGLGKTFEALAIIKHFELLNYRVLVLCPKKLKENWNVYQAQNNSKLNPFLKDRFSFSVLCHTDLSRDAGYSGDINLEQLNWGNYDLIVIDESHNFRNNTKGKRDDEGQIIKKSRYERLMEDIISSGVKTKVLLLSATPVNNTLSDLRNQIYFITESNDHAFTETIGIASIKDTLQGAQRSFTHWADTTKGSERNTGELLDQLSSSFFTILDELTIARSRKHVQNYYKDELENIGQFPERKKPISLYPEIDLKKRFLSYDKLNSEISNYQLSLFNPSKFIKPEYKQIYIEKTKTRGVQVFTQIDRESFLINMMKINFLKRLESSVESFEITMDRTIKKIERLLNKIEKFEKMQLENEDIDYEELEPENLEDEELADALQVGKKLTFNLAHLNLDNWVKELKNDKDQLIVLHNAAQSVEPVDDAKLIQLKDVIETKVNQPTKNNDGKINRKIVVFTAFADTALYLYNQLKDWSKEDLKTEIAMVSGGNSENKATFGNKEFNHILTNFSPISKQRADIDSMPQEGEIDILIATDCISEGQNLQDCDLLVNYDIHWNPVRIIQRFGRIDRIGSRNKSIQLVNFWPTKDLEKYINLKNRVEARMALVDITATGDDALLNESMKGLVEDEITYREKQLLRFKDEVLDLEDFSETVTLSEFTLDDFRMELSRYIEKNRKVLEDAPLGLYAIVPSPTSKYSKEKNVNLFDHVIQKTIRPGIIFCLKQKGDTSGNEQVNPLQPYYLVYLYEEGDVRFNFTHPKQILEVFRLLCSEKTEPYQKLCAIFNKETNDGTDMKLYKNSLDRAVKAIVSTFKRRTVQNLLSGRGGQIIDEQKQISQTSDFDLITWLIIK